MTHSPTPWIDDGDCFIRDENEEIVAVLYASDVAGFIVTAVNAYEANQALIKQLVEALDTTRSLVAVSCQDGLASESLFLNQQVLSSALRDARKAGF